VHSRFRDKFRKKLENDINFIHSELLQSVYNLPVEKIDMINKILLNFLGSQALIFEKRIKESKIIEVQGIFDPNIFACSRGLRLLMHWNSTRN